MKSHFMFSKKQRSGIFLLLLLIVALQCIYFFVDFSSKEVVVDENELIKYQNELDSLRKVEVENLKPKLSPFNPNYITDYKGYTLGMTNEEIDRLLAFRKENKWVNSAQEFQNVTKISDSYLQLFLLIFSFPNG